MLASVNNRYLILTAFVLVGFLLRFVGQPSIPAGFHRDEAGIAYSAYSILQTGRDDWGQLLPLHTKALGDYPPAFYNYLVAASIPVFGLSELAERWPAIVFGTLLIPLSFLWVRKLFRSTELGLVVAAIVTISPWDLVQSRSGSEAVVALAFALLAWLLWSEWVKKPKTKVMLIIGLLYAGALFSYNGVKLALPLLQLLLTWYWWKDIRKKLHIVSFGIVFVIISFASVYIIPGAGDNFAGNSIFTNAQPIGQEYFFREGNMHVPILVSRIFHNKLASLTTQTIGNAGTFLSSNFLFFSAGKPGRYEVPGAGQLLPFFAPFLLLGIFVSTRFTQRQRLLLLGWISIAILPAVLTTTAFPHVKRSMFLYLPLYVFIAEGIYLSVSWLRQVRFGRLLLLPIALTCLWSFGYFLNQYHVHTQYETILARDYGYKEAYSFLSTVESRYIRVHVFGFDEAPDIFYFFYRKVDPRRVQALADTRPSNIFATEENRRNYGFDNYLFDVASCPETDVLQDAVLYFANAICLDVNGGTLAESKITKIHEIDYPNGNKRFIIFEKL